MMNLVVVILISVFKRHGSKNQVKKTIKCRFFYSQINSKKQVFKTDCSLIAASNLMLT